MNDFETIVKPLIPYRPSEEGPQELTIVSTPNQSSKSFFGKMYYGESYLYPLVPPLIYEGTRVIPKWAPLKLSRVVDPYPRVTIIDEVLFGRFVGASEEGTEEPFGRVISVHEDDTCVIETL